MRYYMSHAVTFSSEITIRMQEDALQWQKNCESMLYDYQDQELEREVQRLLVFMMRHTTLPF